jgi:preprotein translocase subunit SecG
MEALLYTTGITAAVFIVIGIYLHLLRKRSEDVFPAPFLNPPRKRKPKHGKS